MPTVYFQSANGSVTPNDVPSGDLSYWLSQGWTQTDPSTTQQTTNAPSNIAPPTATSNYPNYPTTQSGSNPLPVVSDPNQATGNYARAGIVTPALKVDELYNKYFGRVGSTPEREQWIFRPIEELDAFLRQEYKNATAAGGNEHEYDGTPITEGNQLSNRDLNPEQFANTPDPQVTPEAGDAGTPGAGTPEAGDSGTTESTGNAQFDEMIALLQTYLEQLTERGETINPDIEITAESVAEFMARAENDESFFTSFAEGEINPFYASQLALAREGFLTSVGYSGNELLQFENQLEQRYGQAVRGIGESAAEVGFAQSGIRQRGERDLATETQNTIDTGRRNLEFNVGQQARTFAQQFGSAQLPGQNINNAPNVIAGQRNFQDIGGQSPLYDLSDDVYQNIIGTNEFEQQGAISQRASELEAAFRLDQSINQQEELTL